MSKLKQFKVNEEEEMYHEWLKDFFGFRDKHGEDSQTVKQAEVFCYNVLHNLFGDNIKAMFQRESRDELIRRRTIQHENLKKSNTINQALRGNSNTKAKWGQEIID